MNVLRFARRPMRTTVPKRKLRLVKPKAKQQGHWQNVEGFIPWFREHGSTMTNRDLVAAIQEHFKLRVTLGAVTNLRRNYAVPMDAEAQEGVQQAGEWGGGGPGQGRRSLAAEADGPDAPYAADQAAYFAPDVL